MEYQPIHALFYNVFQVLKVYTSYKTYTIRCNAQFIYDQNVLRVTKAFCWCSLKLPNKNKKVLD